MASTRTISSPFSFINPVKRPLSLLIALSLASGAAIAAEQTITVNANASSEAAESAWGRPPPLPRNAALPGPKPIRRLRKIRSQFRS